MAQPMLPGTNKGASKDPESQPTSELAFAAAAAVVKKNKKKSKSGQASQTPPTTTTTPPPHDALCASLRPKYNVLPAFTISSNKIQKRVSRVLQHLRRDDEDGNGGANGDGRRRAALLFARPAEVGKMITISEQVKRIVAGEGGRWFQYNLMYELPPKPEVVEETVLGRSGGGGGGGSGGRGRKRGRRSDDGEEDDDDDFEVMGDGRFESAVMTQPKRRAAMSLCIFLSLEPMPELKTKEGVTVQTNEPPPGAPAAAEGA